MLCIPLLLYYVSEFTEVHDAQVVRTFVLVMSRSSTMQLDVMVGTADRVFKNITVVSALSPRTLLSLFLFNLINQPFLKGI